MCKPAVLVFAGLDPQGAAGLSADIATVNHFGCHALPVMTAYTEQTSQGLHAVHALSVESFIAQYESAVADFTPAAIKIGFIPNAAIATCIAEIIDKHAVPVVLDPVLGASSGGMTADDALIECMRTQLLPRTTLLTPNLPEANRLTGQQTNQSMLNSLLQTGAENILLKGGHDKQQVVSDVFASQKQRFYLFHSRHDKVVRGTGCVLASVISACLARGEALDDSLILSRAYINRGIRLAQQTGPYHLFHHADDVPQGQDFPGVVASADMLGKSMAFPDCPKRLGIYPVVDSADWVERLVDCGVKTLQLRLKNLSEQALKEEISRAVALCRHRPGVHLFINDHWQQAIECGAYGVHLGQEDLHQADVLQLEQAGLRLGISTHSYWELARALSFNPSYVALGPVFETTSKDMPWQPQGLDRIHEWMRLLAPYQKPLVAIGGIDVPRAQAVKTTGVGSVAMISAITRAADYQQVVKDLLQLWQTDNPLGLNVSE